MPHGAGLTRGPYMRRASGVGGGCEKRLSVGGGGCEHEAKRKPLISIPYIPPMNIGGPYPLALPPLYSSVRSRHR
jgi:hypothetical protein